MAKSTNSNLSTLNATTNFYQKHSLISKIFTYVGLVLLLLTALRRFHNSGHSALPRLPPSKNREASSRSRYNGGREATIANHLLHPYDVAHHSHSATTATPFYIYESDTFIVDSRCNRNDAYAETPSGGYMCITSEFIKNAMAHPWRVRDPAKAKIFVVPFDVSASYAAKSCGGSDHWTRLRRVINALYDSVWYQRNTGRDHFWTIPAYQLPKALRQGTKFFPSFAQEGILQNMTVGRYLNYFQSIRHRTNIGFTSGPGAWPFEPEEWGCTIATPILSAKSITLQNEYSFDHWNRRNVFMFFRGRGHCAYRSAKVARTTAVRLGMQNLSWPTRIIMSDEHASSRDAYFSEILDSKYCLIFACDDPQTSRFYDAIAAGCIPIVINDAWRPGVAAFTSRINYDAFTVTVPESLWNSNPAAALHFAYDQPQAALRKRYDALMRARPQLLWRHPQSKVVENLMLEIVDCMDTT